MGILPVNGMVTASRSWICRGGQTKGQIHSNRLRLFSASFHVDGWSAFHVVIKRILSTV